LKSNPSKCQDSATTISGTKQHDQTPQVRGSNSHTSHKCTPESTDTISNQKYSNLPLYGEKRAASLSLSDRDGEMSDDSVSILDDNFQTKQTTVLSRDHKRRKIEVKEEAHSQLEYPDPNFVEVILQTFQNLFTVLLNNLFDFLHSHFCRNLMLFIHVSRLHFLFKLFNIYTDHLNFVVRI
jgi:hypothetical protein